MTRRLLCDSKQDRTALFHLNCLGALNRGCSAVRVQPEARFKSNVRVFGTVVHIRSAGCCRSSGILVRSSGSRYSVASDVFFFFMAISKMVEQGHSGMPAIVRDSR